MAKSHSGRHSSRQKRPGRVVVSESGVSDKSKLQAKIDQVMSNQSRQRRVEMESVMRRDAESTKRTLASRILSTVGWCAWLVAVWLLSSMITSAISVIVYRSTGYNLLSDTVGVAVMQVGQLVLMLLMAVGIPYRLGEYKILTRAKRRAVQMNVTGMARLPNATDLLPFLTGVVGYYIIVLTLTIFASLILPESIISQQQNVGFATTGNVWWQIGIIMLVLVVLTPVLEELIFRGFLLGKLERVAQFWPAALVTSLLFALAHGQVNVGITTFILSMINCLLRRYTGSIWAGVGVHMVVNLVATLVVFIWPMML